MNNPPQLISYFNEPLRVSLLVPDSWEVQQVKHNQFQIVAPAVPQFDGYCPRISYTRTIPEADSLDWFERTIRNSEATIAQIYSEYQQLKEERFWVGEHRAYLRAIQWCYEGTDIYLVNFQGLIWAETIAAYIIKAETLKEFAETDLPMFEAIAKSTRIIEGQK